MQFINPFDYKTPREVAAAVAAATDDQLGPALMALSAMTGRTCTRADLLALINREVEAQEN